MRSSIVSCAGLVCLTLTLARGTARADDLGYLGVTLDPVPEALSAHLKTSGGALVMRVMPGSPAEKVGLQHFDIIVSVNGAPAKSPDTVRGQIQERKQGDLVKLEVLRGTETLNLEVTLGAFPVELPSAKPQAESEPEAKKHEESHRGFLGIGPAEVPPVLASHLSLDEGMGVVVGDVLKDSPAGKAGIEAKDVLTSLDGKAIHGTADFLKSLSEKKDGDPVKIDLVHKGEKKSLTVTLGPRPKNLPGADWMMPSTRDWNNFFGPHTSRRGKMTIQGPDGQEHIITLPDSIWKYEDLLKDLESKLGQFQDVQIPDLKKSLRESLRDLEERLQDGKEVGDPRWPSTETHSSVIRSVDGEYDITVKDENGSRTVTVIKGGKALATDLPYDQLGTQPAEVQERVHKVMDSMKIIPSQKGGVHLPGEGNKIRA